MIIIIKENKNKRNIILLLGNILFYLYLIKGNK